MSTVRQMRRRLERDAIRTARRAARAQGCVCHPTIEVTAWVQAVPFVNVTHDSWCVLLRVQETASGQRAPQVVLTLDDPAQAALQAQLLDEEHAA